MDKEEISALAYALGKKTSSLDRFYPARLNKLLAEYFIEIGSYDCPYISLEYGN